MNETPVSDGLVDEASIQSRNQKERTLSNRILGYAFVASVVVNIGWVALVSNSNLFGKGGALPMLHEKPIKVFKPIPVKPKPKAIKPPPPPPKPPKVQPKIKPIKPVVQHQRPHPTPPRPTPPTHQVSVRTTTNTHTTSHLTAQSAPPADNPAPFVPNPGPPTPPTPPVPPTPTPPTPTHDPGPSTPIQQAPKPTPSPPPVVVVHHPSNWVPIDTREASYPDGLGSDVTTDGIDATSITGTKVVIAFTIDETGHFRDVHVKESSGSSELDNRFLDAVRRGHGSPAIQDHIPRDQPESISFNVGG